jgi:U1 small nuclear ribonucleoprotein
MTDKLPPQLLALFTPRPAVRFLPPSDFAPEDRHTPAIGGIGQYLSALQEYKETDEYHPTESWLQRRDRIRREKMEKAKAQLEQGLANCKADQSSLIDANETNRQSCGGCQEAWIW